MLHLDRVHLSCTNDKAKWAQHLMQLLVKRSSNKQDRQSIAAHLMQQEPRFNGNLTDNIGYTVLSHAVKNGLDGVVETILRESGNRRRLLNEGTPHPLWIASSEADLSILEILLKYKELIQIDKSVALDATSPLTMALIRGVPEVIEIMGKFYSSREVEKANREFQDPSRETGCTSITRRLKEICISRITFIGFETVFLIPRSWLQYLDTLNLKRNVPLFNEALESKVARFEGTQLTMAKIESVILTEFCPLKNLLERECCWYDVEDVNLSRPCPGGCNQ